MKKPILRTLILAAAAALAYAGCTYDATGHGGGSRGGGNGDDSTFVDSTKFVDSRDRTTYRKVTIGSQVWMAENLNYNVPDNTTDVCYGDRAGNCAEYGRLYDWVTAMDIDTSYNSTNWVGRDVKRQGVCPVGWHLPTDAEWTQLTDYVGGASTAGKKLKSSTGWTYSSDYYTGTDEYRFSALPGGYGNSAGGFSNADNYGYWWSATEYNAYNTYYRYMNYLNESVSMNYYDKDNKFSVRCVRD